MLQVYQSQNFLSTASIAQHTIFTATQGIPCSSAGQIQVLGSP